MGDERAEPRNEELTWRGHELVFRRFGEGSTVLLIHGIAGRLEIFEEASHFPHQDEPERFARVFLHFLSSIEPGRLSDDMAALPAHAMEGSDGRGADTTRRLTEIMAVT